MDDEIVLELDHELVYDGDDELDAEIDSLADTVSLLDALEIIDIDTDELIDTDEELDILSCSVGEPEFDIEYDGTTEFDIIDE
jgi:hypothetical protein